RRPELSSGSQAPSLGVRSCCTASQRVEGEPMESNERWRESPQNAVAMACRVLGAQGQSDMVWGHVAIRDDAGRGVWIKAHLRGFEEVTPDDVLLIDWDGKVLEGNGRRHGEFPIHTEIMAARPDVNFTVHT